MPPTLQAREVIRRLSEAGAEFVLVGGVAVNFHGFIYSTTDIDFCIPMVRENLLRVLRAIEDLNPRQRMRPDRAKLPADLAEVPGLRNFYVETTAGWVDFLGEIEGVGGFEQVKAHSTEEMVNGVPCRVLDLDALIAAKRAADRPKDRLAVTQLEAIRKLRAEMKLQEGNLGRAGGGDEGGGAPI